MFSDSPPAGPPFDRHTSSIASDTTSSQATRDSIYVHHRTTARLSGSPSRSPSSLSATSMQPAVTASGYPSQAAMPISFNDLPCRAQHLILNELITRQSQETAVMFTTLPYPIEGTCLHKETSEAYLSDLEVLCHDLPPCLLVHSNSMTVTMNL